MRGSSKWALHVGRVARRSGLLRSSARSASSATALATTCPWIAAVGFVLAAVLGLYMGWKIIRTPGEL